MIILSIDVGIKNLSHCLFRVDDTITLLRWDTVDLTDDHAQTCSSLTKKGTTCGKRAKFRKHDHCYCLTHAKTSPFSLPAAEFRSLSTRRKQQLIDLCVVRSIPWDTTDPKPELVRRIRAHQEATELVLVRKKNANTHSIVDLGKTLNERYNATFQDFSIDAVLVENQIGPLATRMKTLQGMVSQYWIMKGVDDIQFVSAHNKLKPFMTGKSTYEERKAKGIEVATKYVSKYPGMDAWNEAFLSHTKKDDLSDSLLQGLWYVAHHNLANIEIN